MQTMSEGGAGNRDMRGDASCRLDGLPHHKKQMAGQMGGPARKFALGENYVLADRQIGS